ncbi:MAG TPA: hypothetical protein VM370_04890 [Candidatus Thermoplasmatota archaeon]|nr:hypothetical protein [Candidatus Thermoplasmatota archaeon]
MRTIAPSASHAALALALLLVVATPAIAGPLHAKSVGEIVVDAQGRATGQNLAGDLSVAEGAISSFRSLSLGTTVFRTVTIDGFSAAEAIAGSGSSVVTWRGSNAIVTLHDNLHSMLVVRATQPTSVVYGLAPDVTATPAPGHAGVLRLSQGAREIGSLVAVGDDGPRSRGEVLEAKGADVVARLFAGSELVFLARPETLPDAGYQDALVAALAQGALVSYYATELEGSHVAASQVDPDPFSVASTRADPAGFVETALAARPRGETILVYDLAYETLPAGSDDDDDDDVAVFHDGLRAERVDRAADVLARAEDGVPAYYAITDGGRTQVVASGGEGGEHRIVVTVGAQARTEPQARAEGERDDDARVYGDLEYHGNGKITGAFLSGLLPENAAHLLGFTSLATQTEVFRDVSVGGGAAATIRASDRDAIRIESARSDLTLTDDVHATLVLHARAPEDARYGLADGIRASQLSDGIVALEGPRGSMGALVLVGPGALALDAGAVRAHLAGGSSLVYRGAPDAHASERALLDAIEQGRLGAQLLAGVHDGALAAKATSYSDDVQATIRATGAGRIEITYLAQEGAARVFALDSRGAALVAQSAGDLRVLVDGASVEPAASAEDALAAGGAARAFVELSADGALRVLVHTASAAGDTAVVTIQSVAAERAQAQARTDAFGAFHLSGDGSALGSYVTLHVDRAAGAVSGLTTVADGRALFASIAAGSSAYGATAGEGASVLALANREARVEVSDSTNAFLKIVALEETDAAFRLAEGLRATQTASGVLSITDGDGDAVGSLVASPAATIGTRGAGDVRAHLLAGGEIVFRTHDGIEAELSDAQRTMIDDAIAGGRVAAHVTLSSSTGVARSAAATYGDVEVLTSATTERVAITIDSATARGRTLLVSLDPATIPGMALGRASIRFDGALVGEAASYADILDAGDDAGLAEAFVLAGEAGTQVLVSIPHFSVHTVTLEQRGESHDTLFMYATIVLGLLVIVESVLLARNARKNKLSHNERRP